VLDEEVKILSGGDIRLSALFWLSEGGITEAMKTHTGHLETEIKKKKDVQK
jgi:hypothetical protein